MTLVDGEKPDPPDELREQIALRQADLDSEEVISSLEANTSLPGQTREKLIARLREASASQADPDAQGQADEVLARAQADRDAAVARQDEADTRVADGDPTAQSEAETARTARSRAEDTLTAARARAARAQTGDPEADAGIEAREVSFPAPAGRARARKTNKRGRSTTKNRADDRHAGKAR